MANPVLPVGSPPPSSQYWLGKLTERAHGVTQGSLKAIAAGVGTVAVGLFAAPVTTITLGCAAVAAASVSFWRSNAPNPTYVFGHQIAGPDAPALIPLLHEHSRAIENWKRSHPAGCLYSRDIPNVEAPLAAPRENPLQDAQNLTNASVKRLINNSSIFAVLSLLPVSTGISSDASNQALMALVREVSAPEDAPAQVLWDRYLASPLGNRLSWIQLQKAKILYSLLYETGLVQAGLNHFFNNIIREFRTKFAINNDAQCARQQQLSPTIENIILSMNQFFTVYNQATLKFIDKDARQTLTELRTQEIENTYKTLSRLCKDCATILVNNFFYIPLFQNLIGTKWEWLHSISEFFIEKPFNWIIRSILEKYTPPLVETIIQKGQQATNGQYPFLNAVAGSLYDLFRDLNRSPVNLVTLDTSGTIPGTQSVNLAVSSLIQASNFIVIDPINPLRIPTKEELTTRTHPPSALNVRAAARRVVQIPQLMQSKTEKALLAFFRHLSEKPEFTEQLLGKMFTVGNLAFEAGQEISEEVYEITKNNLKLEVELYLNQAIANGVNESLRPYDNYPQHVELLQARIREHAVALLTPITNIVSTIQTDLLSSNSAISRFPIKKSIINLDHVMSRIIRFLTSINNLKPDRWPSPVRDAIARALAPISPILTEIISLMSQIRDDLTSYAQEHDIVYVLTSVRKAITEAQESSLTNKAKLQALSRLHAQKQSLDSVLQHHQLQPFPFDVDTIRRLFDAHCRSELELENLRRFQNNLAILENAARSKQSDSVIVLPNEVNFPDLISEIRSYFNNCPESTKTYVKTLYQICRRTSNPSAQELEALKQAHIENIQLNIRQKQQAEKQLQTEFLLALNQFNSLVGQHIAEHRVTMARLQNKLSPALRSVFQQSHIMLTTITSPSPDRQVHMPVSSAVASVCATALGLRETLSGFFDRAHTLVVSSDVCRLAPYAALYAFNSGYLPKVYQRRE